MSFLAATLFTALGTPSAQARVEVSVEIFYNNLDAYGTWQEVGEYGFCWQPRKVKQDWRPYSDGRWVYTDAGWTWDSDEPYSWAVYHYGRWANVERIGWIWVPGTEWGPGWVSWRHSPKYVGWAPLPPEARLIRTIGLNAWVDDHYNIGPANYRFVEGRNFGSRHLGSVFIDHSRNVSIINLTTNITNITYKNNIIHNGGPDFDKQSRLSSEPIKRYKLELRQDLDGDSRRIRNEDLQTKVTGDSLSVVALPISGKSSSPPKNAAAKVDRAEINHGWKNAGTPVEVATLRKQMKGNAQAPDGLPAKAKFDKTPENPVAEPAKETTKPDATPDHPKRAEGKPSTDPSDKPSTEPKRKGKDKTAEPTPPDSNKLPEVEPKVEPEPEKRKDKRGAKAKEKAKERESSENPPSKDP